MRLLRLTVGSKLSTGAGSVDTAYKQLSCSYSIEGLRVERFAQKVVSFIVGLVYNSVTVT